MRHCSNIATLCCTKNRRCESSRATSPLHLSVIVTCLFMLSLFLSVFSRDSLRAEIHNKEVQLQKEKEIITARCDRHFLNCPLMFCFVLSFTLTYFRNRPMSSLNIVPLLLCTYSVKFIRAKLLLVSNLFSAIWIS